MGLTCNKMGAVLALCAPNVPPHVRMDSKSILITGANSGIGKECTLDFYKRGAKIIMACRSIERAEKTMEEIKKECVNIENVGSMKVVELDLMSLDSVRECAENLLKSRDEIDILLNNAGIMACPFRRTNEGFESQFGTNHLGHFLFTLLLMPKLMKSRADLVRIVTVSSVVHLGGKIDFDDINFERREYHPFTAYMQSKLANILFTKELARRIEEAGLKDKIHCYSLHPGVINTELGQYLDDTYFKGFYTICVFPVAVACFKTPKQGAQTSIYCCIGEKCAKETGLYYSESEVTTPSRRARNAESAKRLWDESLKMAGLPPDYNPFLVVNELVPAKVPNTLTDVSIA